MRRGHIDRNILFLYKNNACLSQMAEATAKHLAPPRTQIFSAGVKPSSIPPRVVQAMQELGISMSGQTSKGLAEVPIQVIDLVVSFGDAHKKCVNLPGRVKVENWPVRAANPTSALTARRFRSCAKSATISISAYSRCFSITGATMHERLDAPHAPAGS